MKSGVHDWLARYAGLEPTLLNGASFDHAVERRMSTLGLRDAAAYVERLRTDDVEAEHLISAVAVPESSLFRYPQSFEYLASYLGASLREPGRPERPLRMLSVACAMGQEPCAMAVTALHAGWPAAQVHITAVDRNRRFLARAKHGWYAKSEAGGETPGWANPWLRNADDGVEVDPEVLASIDYVHADVLSIPCAGVRERYDIVFCRNLMIYLHRAARARLASSLYAWTAPRGLLFVGHAERLPVLRPHFESADMARTFALRRRSEEAAKDDIAAPGPSRRVRSTATTRQTVSRRVPARTPPPPSIGEARSLASQGRIEEAMALTSRLLATRTPGADDFELLGSLQCAMGRFDDARDTFRKAIYLEPEHEAALLQLAMISERLNEEEEAARYRRRALRAHQRSEDGRDTDDE